VMVVLYFLWSVFPATVRIRGFAVPLRILVLLLLVAQFVSYPLRFMSANPPDTQIVEVSDTLRAAGMRSADEVLSTHVDFHDVGSPWKQRYDMAFVHARDLVSYEQLQQFLQDHGYRFFVFDKQTGVNLYPDLEFLRYPENRPTGLAPVFVHDKRDFVIYRVLEGDWPEPQPVGVEWENGILLAGYDLYRGDDAALENGRRLGLYLHWEASQPLGSFLKVFVHVFDETGQLVAQHDSVPALWTNPTSDWVPGETVVDFHPLFLDGAQGRGPFTVRVGLYDPGNGQRIPAVDAPGDQVENAVVLESFMFEDEE
jgi:hypothetical protein